jgi:signal transduction histidine kinase
VPEGIIAKRSWFWGRPSRGKVLFEPRRARDAGPQRWQLLSIALAGSLAAAAVGYLVSENPTAAPPHVAVAVRVALIVTLMGTGIYDLTRRGQARMGGLLVGSGFYACVWLLNGSTHRVLFSLGVLVAGLAPTIFAYLVLAYPRGRLRSKIERRFLASAGGVLALCWTIVVLSSNRLLKTALLPAHPPSDIFSLGSLSTGAATTVKAGAWLSWTAVACGTPLLLSRALRTAAGPLRRSWIPVEGAAWICALCYLAFAAAHAASSHVVSAFGAAYVISALTIPLGILAKLELDRTLMGRALSGLVDQLAESPRADPQALMALALHDPSLSIAYPRRGLRAYVDGSGDPVVVPDGDERRAVVWIEPDRGPVAAVIYDARLADQSAFVHAAGAAATIRLEAAQLEAELNASTSQLAASRLRLQEAADAERQRIERDLHDGAQQQVVGMRLRLDLASEAIKTEPARGERMLATVGRELDELLSTLRSLAKGIYPSILEQRGLREALASVALSAPVPVSVVAPTIQRYAEDIEVAVYFCCLEAIQNVIKHAGTGARAWVRLSQHGDWLRFEVRDSGQGFDAQAVPSGSGLVNMRDRIEAVAGRLWITSGQSEGTLVRGRVPAALAKP